MSIQARKFDAALWIVLVLAYASITLASVFAWNGPPSIGVDGVWRPDQGVGLTWLNPYGPASEAGARLGDVLAEVDGQPLTEQRWEEQSDAGTSFVFMRPSTGDALSGMASNERFVRPESLALLEIVGLAFALVGSLVFLRSQRTSPIVVFMVFSLVSAMAFGISPASARYATWASVTQSLLIQWFLMSFVMLFAVFPEMRIRRGSAITIGVAAIGGVTVALNALTVTSVFWVPSLFAVTRTLGFLHLVAGIVMGIGLVVTAYRNAPSPVDREQLRIMVVGSVLAVLPFIALSIIPSLAFSGQILRPDTAALAIVLIPLSFAYSIKRYQLFGIRRLVHRGVAYFLISITVVALFAGTITSLNAAGQVTLASSALLQGALLALLFAGGTFLSTTRRLAFQTIDKVLYKDFVDFPQLIRDVSINAAAATSMDELKERAMEPIRQELRVEFVALATFGRDLPTPWLSVGQAPTPRALTQHTVRLVDRVPGQKSTQQQYLPEAGANLLSLTVPGENEHVFAMVIGPKETQEPFVTDEVRALEAIAGQLATIVDKLELVDELRQKSQELQELNRMLVEANEAERARIAAHLHDDPLQKITYVLWLCQDHNVPAEVVTYLHDVVSDLRNFTALLRPVELQDLGLARALEALVDEVESRSSFSADLRVTGLSRDGRLPDEIELGVYRIVQEALNNCLKHAQASNVWVRVTFRDWQVRVSIEDDGKGMAPVNGDRRPRMGIPGMRQRAEQLGGQLTISPRKPQGTSVKAEIPVPEIESAADGPLLLGANHD